MTQNYKVRPDLGWLLDELVAAPEARNAILLSADGLMTASSQNLDRDLADRVAAMASGMQSLSRSGAQFVEPGGSPWEQTMALYQHGYLFTIAAAAGSFLIASAGRDVDVAAFSHQMALTVKRLGKELAVAPRNSQAGTA